MVLGIGIGRRRVRRLAVIFFDGWNADPLPVRQRGSSIEMSTPRDERSSHSSLFPPHPVEPLMMMNYEAWEREILCDLPGIMGGVGGGEVPSGEVNCSPSWLD